MSDCKVIGYIPEIDIVRFKCGETIYNIDADVIAGLWQAYVEGHGGDYDMCENCECRTEQKTGRWEIVFRDNQPWMAICSECGKKLFFTDRRGETTPNYCPDCGAKMDRQRRKENATD